MWPAPGPGVDGGAARDRVRHVHALPSPPRRRRCAAAGRAVSTPRGGHGGRAGRRASGRWDSGAGRGPGVMLAARPQNARTRAAHARPHVLHTCNTLARSAARRPSPFLPPQLPLPVRTLAAHPRPHQPAARPHVLSNDLLISCEPPLPSGDQRFCIARSPRLICLTQLLL